MPLALAVASPSASNAQSERTASLPPPDRSFARDTLPTVLGAEDAYRYRSIFALQRHDRWHDADRQIALLRDPLLMGEVLAQRYLSRDYRASYGELSDWLRAYAGLPESAAIHSLAVKRRPAGAAAVAIPASAQTAMPDEGGDLAGVDRLGDPFGSAQTRLTTARLPFKAGDGEATRAGFAFTAIQESTHGGPGWDAGLSAWRAGRYALACQYFEHAARAKGAGPGQVAAAAFWAARSELRNHHPEAVDAWLDLAASHPHTFHGLLARRTLGVDISFNFDFGPLSDAHSRLLRGLPAGRWALALIQVGETDVAEVVLRQLAWHGDAPTQRAVEALADRAGMPSLSFHLAALLARSDDTERDRAMFPIPRWTPADGFKVDRALLFALMRQESQFQPDARSPSGAIGPMQMMPATARSMARRLALPEAQRRDLGAPAVNLALAQEYIAELQADERIGDNLLVLIVAYNSGPGPIHQWLASEAVRRDPLLFLESIPNRESRGFAEKVLTNYWIYRLRLGQTTPDLDALAGGQWPTYTALDSGVGASYARN